MHQLAQTYAPGTETEGKAVRLLDKGLVVDLGEEVEGFVPVSQIVEDREIHPAPIYAVTPSEYPGQQYKGLRVGPIKYIVDHDDREELYDLAEDPLETKNLAAERPKQVAEFREWLASGPWEAGDHKKPIELPLEDASPAELEQLRALGYVQ